MAETKNRPGSVIIYGPLQANTSEGIVAYTDAIVRETSNGGKRRLNNILDSDFVKVTDISTLSETDIKNIIEGA